MAHSKQTELFAGIEDMPIARWQDFNLALLLESGAGEGIEGLESQLATAYRHIANKEQEKASVIIANCLQNIAFAKEKVVPLTFAYAAMVRSIDGVDVSHLSAEQVHARLDLSNQKVSYLKQIVEAFRKKCLGELEAFFPQFAKNPIEAEHANYLKKRTTVLLDFILNDTDPAAELERVDNYLFSLHRPQMLAGAKGAEVKMKKDFDSICLNLQTHGIDRPEMLTVRKFYAAVEMLTKKK